MRKRFLAASATIAIHLATGPSFAQAPGGPGPGPGGDDGGPGAYASPSAIPDDPASRDIGIPTARGLRRFEAIELPKMNAAPAAKLDLPALPSFAAPSPNLDLLKSHQALVLDARLVEDGQAIPSGLVWRLFSPKPGADGKLPVVAVARGGEAVFDVPAGAYLLHVGFGRAGMTRRIDFSGQQTHETVVLKAGGLRLHAKASEKTKITGDKLTFDIYSAATEEQERHLIAKGIESDVVVRLNAGDYHLVSDYGSVNSVVRTDVRVEAGRITDATVEHHAAEITLKLVREHGGEALADTAWSITTEQGDLIRESVGAFPSMVLAEGQYFVVAKNKDRIYQRPFEVKTGENADVEVLTTDLMDPNEGSGD
jgi:hypothetical protein